ncbi:MAG TPA: hypothetical protein VIP98_15140 [Microlunatus sp.]
MSQPAQPPYPGQPYPQQGQSPLPGQQPGPTGQLILQLRRPWGSMGMITPSVRIDGFPATVQWGRNEFTVPAGPRRVEASASYLWQYGRASDTVPVQPGRQVEVHYTPPVFTMMSGRIGPTPMPAGGKPVLIGLLVVLGLAVLLIILGVVLSSFG